MRKNNGLKISDEQRKAELYYFIDRCGVLTKEVAERNATIRLLTKAAIVIEEERDKYKKMFEGDVPF